MIALLLLFVGSAASCEIACTMQWQPVCGTNLQTYGNLCQLESDACRRKESIGVMHVGECQTVAELMDAGCNVACTMQWNPVCGTNAKTYGNTCQMEAEACLMRTSVAIKHAGECVADEVACNQACTLQWAPVCGTNQVTYGNLCALESDSCLKKSGVVVAHMGEC